MSDAIVVLNAGSSSLKFCVYAIDGEKLNAIVKGQLEGIGTSPRFKAKDQSGKTLPESSPAATSGKFTHADALTFLIQWLFDHYKGEMKVIAAGHRVVASAAEKDAVRVAAEVTAGVQSVNDYLTVHTDPFVS